MKKINLSPLLNRPVELIIALVCGIGVLLINDNTIMYSFGHFALAPIFFILSYLLRNFKIAYLASSVLAVLAILFAGFINTDIYFYIHSPYYRGALLIAFVALFSSNMTKSSEEFRKEIVSKSINLTLAFIFAVLATVAALIIMSALNYLFGIFEYNSIFDRIFRCGLVGVFPILFILFDTKKKEPNKLLENILNFIIAPAFIIYTIIIYAYTFKIAVLSGLPKGGVAYMVICYLIFGIFLSVVNTQKWQKLYRSFSIIALIPVVLLGVAIAQRVGSYGFTPIRIYLIALSLWLALSVFAMKFSYKFISLSAVVCIFVTVFLIDPVQISLNSQLKRLNDKLTELNLLDSSGKIDGNLTVNSLKSRIGHKKYDEIYALSHDVKTLDNDFVLKGNKKLIDAITHNQYTLKAYQAYAHHSFYADSKIINIHEYKRLIPIHTACYFDDIYESNCENIFEAFMLPKFDMDSYLETVFKAHNLDINRQYDKDELNKLEDDMTVVDLEQGRLYLSRIEIRFDTQRWSVVQMNMMYFLSKE